MIKNYLQRQLSAFAKDEKAATAIEYGLIVALIAVVLMGTLISTSGSLDTMYQFIESTLSSATP